MLIDSNAHIGHWPFRHRNHNTCSTLIERMNDFGVSAAIVSNLSGCLYKNPHTANEAMVEEIRSRRNYVDRFIMLGVINPIYGGWKDDFQDCIDHYGMRGIKLYPKYHGYTLDHPNCIELAKMARDKDIVIALALRVVDSRPSSWLDINEEYNLAQIMTLVKHVPDGKYLIQNVANSLDLVQEDLALIRSTQLVMDTSGRNINQLGKFLQIFGKNKFAFGSHSPILDYCTGLLRIESLSVSEADEETKVKLRSGNIKELFDL